MSDIDNRNFRKTDMRFSAVIILTILLTASGQLANTIFVPAMAMISKSLNIIPSSMQALISAYLLPYGISQFFYGPAADKYGRKPVIYFGIIIFCLGSIISFVGLSFNIVLLGCFFQGIGAGVGGVMVRTLMRDCFEGEELQKANSYINMAVVCAPLAAPIIGGFIAVRYGWRYVFLFLFIFGVIVFILQKYLLKETNPGNQSSSMREKYSILFHDKSYFRYTSFLLLAFSGIAVFEASLGVILGSVFHLNPEKLSYIFIIPVPFYVLGSFLAGKAIRLISLEKIVNISICVIICSTSLLLFTGIFHILNIVAIIMPICLFMFGIGILCPTATTLALGNLSCIAGTAGAFLGGLQNIGAGLMTFLSSFIPQTTQLPLGIILFGLSMMIGLIGMLSGRKVICKNYQKEFI